MECEGLRLVKIVKGDQQGLPLKIFQQHLLYL